MIECSNKSKLLVSSHTGGNYIFHRYLFDILGKTVNEKQGLKGGYTDWLWNGGSKLKHGYIYPLQFFRLPELYRIWENYKHKGIVDDNAQWLEREKVSARKLLELKR